MWAGASHHPLPVLGSRHHPHPGDPLGQKWPEVGHGKDSVQSRGHPGPGPGCKQKQEWQGTLPPARRSP